MSSARDKRGPPLVPGDRQLDLEARDELYAEAAAYDGDIDSAYRMLVRTRGKPAPGASSTAHKTYRGIAPAARRTETVFDHATRGSGTEVPFRADMEERFGASFADVEAHLGISALRDVGANAAAKGNTVAFVSNSPSRPQVAHELTHVLQQRRHGITAEAASRDVSEVGDAAEREANANAQAVAQAHFAVALTGNAPPTARLHLDRDGQHRSGATDTQPPDTKQAAPKETPAQREANRPQNVAFAIDKDLLEYKGTEFLVQLQIRTYGALLPKYGYKKSPGDIRIMLRVASPASPSEFWSWKYAKLRAHVQKRYDKKQPFRTRVRHTGNFLKRWETYQEKRKKRFAQVRAQRHDNKGLTHAANFAGWLAKQWWKGAAKNDPVFKGVGNVSDFASGVFDGVQQWLDDMKGMLKGLASLVQDVATSTLNNSLFLDLLRTLGKLLQVDPKKLVNAIIPGLGDLGKKWKSWHFRGKLVGYVLAEALAAAATGLVKIGLRVVGKAAAEGAKLVESIRRSGVVKRVEKQAKVLSKTKKYREKVKEAAAGMVKTKGGKAGRGKGKLGKPGLPKEKKVEPGRGPAKEIPHEDSNLKAAGGRNLATEFPDPKERAIAEYLEKLGRKVSANPLEGVPGAGRQGDAIVDGVLCEFKTLDPSASPSRIKNVVNESIRGGGQAREIIIDARGSGLTEEMAKQGAGKALGISRGRLDGLTILGDGYFFRWKPR